MREDKPLEAPSLVELSAHIVACSDNMYKYSQFVTPASSSCNSTDSSECTSPITTCSSSPNSPYSFIGIPPKIYRARHFYRPKTPPKEEIILTLKTVELPIEASEMVFKFVSQNLKQSEDDNNSVNIIPAANRETVSQTLRPFMDGVRCPLRNMDLSGLNVSDKTLGELLKAQKNTLTRLDLSAIQGLNSGQICQFLYASDVQLNSLKLLKLTTTDLFRMPKLRRANSLENSSYICQSFPQALPVVSEHDIMDEKFRIDIKMEEDTTETPTEMEFHFMNFCPKLEELILQQGLSYNIEDENPDQFLRRILSCTPALRVLDLSEWQSIFQMNVLTSLKNLTTLILYDVPHLESSISTLVQLENLITLDLSQSDKLTGQYNQPVTALHSLVIHLLKLKYLDISGTNLMSPSSDEDRPFRGTGLILSDIAGLSYLRKPLKYLGIFNCSNASIFQNIPAEKICGDIGENQILLALKVYMERPKMMQAVLNESYQLYRFTSNLTRHVEALHLVINALRLHKNNANLQIAGSASMFYIIRNVKMNRDTKRKVIYALLTGMENHMEEMVMVRNCCLSLCQFEIPQDILFNYNRVASLLVRVLETHTSDHLSQRIVVFLLNSMACHVEGDQKIEVGNIGAIEIILEQIRRKHAQGTCDDVMEVGWSFLWNITDETPTNCDRFLNAEGLKLFQLCYAQFPNEMELVRNMMGLIGNIAEVESLRSQLMNDDYLRIFVNLLDNVSEGIEISYNSAGVLAHLVSDGIVAWEKVDISRDYVMNEIIRASKSWDLAARRYINYRSFKPILRLLPMFNASGAQHWAVWALANLTTTDIEKYCRYVQDEGGEELLKQIANDSRASPLIQELTGIVLRNLENWRIKLESMRENNREEEVTNMNLMEH